MSDPVHRGALPATNPGKLILQLIEPGREQAAKTWEFDNQATVRIGRARDNDVALRDIHVSRHHVELYFRAGAWEFVSIGRYGSFSEGQVVDRMTLDDGAVLQLGTAGPKLRFLQERPSPDSEVTTAGIVADIGGPPRFDHTRQNTSRPPPFRRIPDRSEQSRGEDCAPIHETMF